MFPTTLARSCKGISLSIVAVTILLQTSAPAIRAAAAPSVASPPTAEALLARANNLVVVIECLSEGAQVGFGSGFVVDSSGLIVTNAHVVLACDEVTLRRANSGRRFPSNIVLVDVEHDIAVLRAPSQSGGAFSLAGKLPRIGQRVYALGHPEGLEFTVSEGIVSAIRELPSGSHLVQTTAPISPGNSGGPLLNEWGQIVGMITLYLVEGQNLNFAVSNYDISKILREARSREASRTSRNDPIAFLSSRNTPGDIAATARGLRFAEKFQLARSVLAQGALCCPEDSLVLLEQAELAWSEQRLEDCKEYTDRLLELFPAFAPGHQCRATLLERSGDLLGARREAELTLELNPNEEYRGFAHANLAAIGIRLGDVPDAILPNVDVALVSARGLGQKRLRVLRACLLEQSGRREEAQREANFAMTLWPGDPELAKGLRQCGLPRGIVVLSKGGAWDAIGNFVVKGVVRNEGSETREFVRVLVESLDGNGTVVASGYDYVEPLYALHPGMTGTFIVYVEGNPRRGVTYRVRVVEE